MSQPPVQLIALALAGVVAVACLGIFGHGIYAELESTEGEPDPIKLADQFRANQHLFKDLEKMIETDRGARQAQCFTVGTDQMGNQAKQDDRFDLQAAGHWKSPADQRIRWDFDAVLKHLDFSKARHGTYMRLLESAGAERATSCQENDRFATRFLVYRSEAILSGCAAEIIHGPEPEPYGFKGHGGDYREVTELSDGWYLSYECS